MKCLIAKQITDDEKVILLGVDSTFTIENIDKGNFKFRTFQDKLASNASRFQSKKYTPDGRILTYLKVRAHDFNVPVPAFMKKRTIEKGNGPQQEKRGHNLGQHSRSRSHNAYLQQPIPEKEMSSSSVSNSPSATSMAYKGASKGKGKSVVKGKRQDYCQILYTSILFYYSIVILVLFTIV